MFERLLPNCLGFATIGRREKKRYKMSNLDSKAKLRWACRRGMLELDVLLRPFVDEAYDALSEEDKAIFQRLLTADDPDLFAWFMGHQECKDVELNHMVNKILNRVKV